MCIPLYMHVYVYQLQVCYLTFVMFKCVFGFGYKLVSMPHSLDTVESAPSTVPGEKGGCDGEKSSAVATPTTRKEPLLRTHCRVRRADNSSHVGEVIQRRLNFENGLTEYYVHYKDCEFVSRVQWNSSNQDTLEMRRP